MCGDSSGHQRALRTRVVVVATIVVQEAITYHGPFSGAFRLAIPCDRQSRLMDHRSISLLLLARNVLGERRDQADLRVLEEPPFLSWAAMVRERAISHDRLAV